MPVRGGGGGRRFVGRLSPFPIVESPGNPATFWVHQDNSAISDATIALEAPRRKIISLNAWEQVYRDKIKAVNSNCCVNVYKDASSTRDFTVSGGVDDADLPTGVGYADADTNHPDWFLLDGSGNRLEYSGYTGHWQMNVGILGYQQKWADNVIANATLHGFDAVFADNVLFQADQYHTGVVSPSYPTDASMQAAYLSFLAYVKPRLNAAGLLLFGNTTNMRTVSGLWNTYMQYLDGGLDEFWLAFGTGNLVDNYAQGWPAQTAEVADDEAGGKTTLLMSHFDVGDTTSFRYTLASYLMVNSGRSAFMEVAATDSYGPPPPYHAEYDWDLGTPTGAYTTVQTGVFRRDFSAGCVVVNANSTGSAGVGVTLGGTYLNEAGSSVTSVTLAGTRGTILRAP